MEILDIADTLEVMPMLVVHNSTIIITVITISTLIHTCDSRGNNVAVNSIQKHLEVSHFLSMPVSMIGSRLVVLIFKMVCILLFSDLR